MRGLEERPLRLQPEPAAQPDRRAGVFQASRHRGRIGRHQSRCRQPAHASAGRVGRHHLRDGKGAPRQAAEEVPVEPERRQGDLPGHPGRLRIHGSGTGPATGSEGASVSLKAAAIPSAVVILGLDPRIHAVTYATGTAELVLHRRRNVDVTAWIPGSARVASLLAPPWNDEARDGEGC
ncbi:hypothetical protein MPL3365_80151 [Mesorhizobium plurifarium]|uniref:Uncharacterized protein n=1 Tax=Mesorhizobium plurifarium TaxID=69974 RepID=A0A090GHZ5_MESPL|nr:hypothetical protein MPL3365_80151 [Mesorhizobium plurifarium]